MTRGYSRLAAIVVGAVLAGACAPRDQRAAIAADVIQQLLPADATREVATVYATLHPLASGVRIMPAFHRDDLRQKPPEYVLTTPSFLVVIDHNSLARFAHDVTYVIAPANGSGRQIHRERWWPTVEGQPHWYRGGYMQAPPEFVVFEGVVALDWRLGGRDAP